MGPLCLEIRKKLLLKSSYILLDKVARDLGETPVLAKTVICT